MSSLNEWLNAYLAALPETIRGSLNDSRLIEAARMALHHGWTPQKAAQLVAQRNYHGKHNPPLIAIIRLEEIAPHPPGTTARQHRTPHPNGCIVCESHQTCDDPVTATIPDSWAVERMALLRRLQHTPRADMDEDSRGQAMADLIAEQQARPWSTSV